MFTGIKSRITQKDIFFGLLRKMAYDLEKTGNILQKVVKKPELAAQEAEQIKTLRQSQRKYREELWYAVNKAFFTPLEREDIFNLAVKVADLADMAAKLSDHLLLDVGMLSDKTLALLVANSGRCFVQAGSAILCLIQKRADRLGLYMRHISNLRDEFHILVLNDREYFDIDVQTMRKKDIYHIMETNTCLCADFIFYVANIAIRND